MEKIAKEKKELIQYLTKVAAARVIEDEMLKSWMKAASEDEQKTAAQIQNEQIIALAKIGQQALQKQAQETAQPKQNQAVAQLLTALQKQASAPSPQDQLVTLIKAAAKQEEIKKEAANKNLLKLLGMLGLGGAAGYGASQYGDDISDLFSRAGGEEAEAPGLMEQLQGMGSSGQAMGGLAQGLQSLVGGGNDSFSGISDLLGRIGAGPAAGGAANDMQGLLSSILGSGGGAADGGGGGKMPDFSQMSSAALPKELSGLNMDSIPNLL